MANTLNNLVPDLYEALDVISRELTGFIPAVSRDSSVARAAIGQNVLVPITSEAAAADNVPGVTAPDTGDAVVDNVAVAITKSKHVPVRWNGEETKGLKNAGTFSTIQAGRFYQAMRTLVNEIEKDLWLEAYRKASRGYGTAGTTPFGTAADLSDFAGVLGILEQNGAPTNDLQLVLGHAAIGNMRGKQSGLFKVNEAGSSDMLRNGMTDRIMNMAIRHSHQVSRHVKGTGAAYVTSGSTAVGASSVALATGTGTVLAGDIATFAADDGNKYVVGSGVAAPGTIRLNKPGAQITIPTGNALTLGNSYTANVAFARSAIVLATRAPAMPDGGDSADDVITITDPLTNLSFEIAVYRQFLQTAYHVRLAWGCKAIKDEHISLLLG
ncbi:P22 coat - protein 5 family protein [Pseudomonas helleri]|uniref:P22 coat-protein 5 family protein n=1 Tax=Pseudomonas helleri TaxID=1608996 RepID=A0A7X2CI05_9PSED|nr:P22 coat - protein 5 family protein [Pseudomonas helleri]MQT96952.1 P22 coat - protein 5 family protein [Pseudomonas helleri]MQU32162.1 P22 coat - protein 5 family protein [Pseudomonas helleri]